MPLRHARLLALAAATLALLLASGPALAQTFAKITTAGNPIVALAGGVTQYGGASWIDADGDGDVELFLNKVGLFRNDGGGTFVLVPGPLADPNQGSTFGNTWADIDNDGDLDVFVSGAGFVGSSLYVNQGGLVFTKVTTGPIGNSTANLAWGCAFADYDLDGRVDLVTAAAYQFAGIEGPNQLFHNDGGGVFSLVTGTPITQDLAPFTIPTWSDYDLDGDPDLFFGAGPANGTLALDFLFRNRHENVPGTFERITAAPLGTDLQDGQVYNWIDYDNDGDLDVYLTNYSGPTGSMANRLYRNDGGTFVAQTLATAGPIANDVAASLASVWQDFENDGDLDCVVTNDGTAVTRYYRNNGNGTFSQLGLANVATSGPHYGAAAGDWDDDGRMDLFVTGNAATTALLRNTTNNTNHWLKVRLTGTVSNRAAIGARVRVKAVIGGVPVWQLREISAQNSFNGMNALEAHFGLGAATVAESLVVEWPSGICMVETAVAADTRRNIVEDTATPVAVSFSRAGFGDGRVSLEWWLPGSSGLEFAVERAAAAGAWSAIGRASVAGTGYLRFEDGGARPGSRYGYRLVRGSGDSAEMLGETWIDVPAALAFGIHGVTPNPGGAPFSVRFTLIGREPATVELVDVSGRRLASAAIAAPAPGPGTVTLGTVGALAKGVYFMRLSQGARRDVRRVVVLE